jgi:hypothetical protein
MEPLLPQELSAAIRETNVGAATGPDGITPRLLTSVFNSGVAFQFLFNLMAMCLLILAVVPTQWR